MNGEFPQLENCHAINFFLRCFVNVHIHIILHFRYLFGVNTLEMKIKDPSNVDQTWKLQ